MKPSQLLALYKIAEMGAHDKIVHLSSSLVARRLGLSQQTAARRLIEMEKEGLIERSTEGKGQRVRITKRGLQSLGEMYRVLKPVFEPSKRELVMDAILFSGMSEGSYYMSLEGYRKQFRSKLGFDPFPGTLNLRVMRDSMDERRELNTLPFVSIDGFADKERTYGGARCYGAVINQKTPAAIVMPIRAHYGEDVIEIIAGQNLRKLLRLKDGDLVNVRVLSGSDQS